MNRGRSIKLKKTLYLATFDVGYTHILRVFYAADEAESQQKKSDLEREINAASKSLEHFPKGFHLVLSTIPGTVELRVCLLAITLACSYSSREYLLRGTLEGLDIYNFF